MPEPVIFIPAFRRASFATRRAHRVSGVAGHAAQPDAQKCILRRVNRDGIAYNVSSDVYRFTFDFKWMGSRNGIAFHFDRRSGAAWRAEARLHTEAVIGWPPSNN